MCFLTEAAERDRTGAGGGKDVRGRAKHVAGAGGRCGDHSGEGAAPSRKRAERCCLHPAGCRGAVREGRGRRPGREVGEAMLPLSLAQHGWGDMTFWVSRAGFLLPPAATRRLRCLSERRKSADLVPRAQTRRSERLQLMMNLPHAPAIG